MAVSITYLDFDPSNPDDLHNVGAFVRAGSDGDQIASQTINSEEWLNVAAVLFDEAGAAIDASNPLDVNVTNTLGINIDLDHTEDSVRLGDGTDFLTSTTVGADIGLDVNLINASVAVTATQLDIDDLNATDDAVQAWAHDGAGTALTSTLVGSDQALDVNVVQSTGSDDALANTAVAAGTTSVGTTAVSAVGTALSDRKYLWLLNNDNKTMFIGPTGVTTSNGFPLYQRAAIEMRLGASVDVQAVSTAAAQDLRYLEAS